MDQEAVDVTIISPKAKAWTRTHDGEACRDAVWKLVQEESIEEVRVVATAGYLA